MADLELFRGVFDQYATDGYLGDPTGELAFGYLRVSSSGQAEEGRTGLPRQIMNVNKVARENHLKIPWDMLFGDDDSGFEFQNRPELTKLRQETKNMRSRRANFIVIENIDRLSRESSWHQGFLIDEFTKKYRMQIVFFDPLKSFVEQAFYGALAHEGMKKTLARMRDANIIKAKSGRITARKPAYGYYFVDSDGNPGEKAKKDTHYAIKEDESHIVVEMFERIAYDGISTRTLGDILDAKYTPPKTCKYWEPKVIADMISNTVYKGDFIANREYEVKEWVPYDENDGRVDAAGREVLKRYTRPEEEWIHVPCPAIVSPELWQAANDMLTKNKQLSPRNTKFPFLLSSLVKCADCGYTMVGINSNPRYKSEEGRYLYRYYRCNAQSGRSKNFKHDIGCTQGQISSKILDDAVWLVVCTFLIRPELTLRHLEQQHKGEKNSSILAEIDYFNRQIEDLEKKGKNRRRFYADLIGEEENPIEREKLKAEYKEETDQYAEAIRGYKEKISLFQSQMISYEQYMSVRQFILDLAEQAKSQGISPESSFEVKRKYIKIVVDRIIVNMREGWFRIEGICGATVPINASKNHHRMMGDLRAAVLNGDIELELGTGREDEVVNEENSEATTSDEEDGGLGEETGDSTDADAKVSLLPIPRGSRWGTSTGWNRL